MKTQHSKDGEVFVNTPAIDGHDSELSDAGGALFKERQYIDNWTEFFGYEVTRDFWALKVSGHTSLGSFTEAEWTYFLDGYGPILGRKIIAYRISHASTH